MAKASRAKGLPDEPSGGVLYVRSHLDSVPQGGHFDGLAGVVAVLCLVDFRRGGARPRRPLKVLGLRGEESAWFGKAYMGSSALLGELNGEDLDLRHRSYTCTLAEAMTRIGVEVERVRGGERFFDVDGAAAHLELHIEQGPVLVASQWPTAIVTGIRGNIRHKDVVCRGEAGHSGAVPRRLRRDAVLAAADLMFAAAGAPGGMIFIRNEHGSHNPHEAMDLDDFVRGVELLRLALREPVGTLAHAAGAARSPRPGASIASNSRASRGHVPRKLPPC